MVCGVEVLQVLAMGVGPSGADEDGLDGGCVVQVVCESGLHRLCVFKQLQRVCLHAGLHKVLHFLKRMWGLDVDAFDCGFRAGVWLRRREAFSVEGAEVQDQQDEAVFAAIVGDGELGKPGRAGVSCLRHHDDNARGGMQRTSRALQAYWYLSKASAMTSRDVRVWACRLFRRSEVCCSSRKAAMRWWMRAHRSGKDSGASATRGDAGTSTSRAEGSAAVIARYRHARHESIDGVGRRGVGRW